MNATISLLNGDNYTLNANDTLRFKEITDANGLNNHVPFEMKQGGSLVCIILKHVVTYEFSK